MLTDTMVANLRQLNAVEEGEKFFAYDDATGQTVKAPQGNLSIGRGRNLQAKGIHKDELELMWLNDVKEAYSNLLEKLPWFKVLDPVRQIVLTDLCFNLGIDGFMEFEHMILFCYHVDYRNAKAALLDSKIAKQEPKRIGHLADILETGKFIPYEA